MRQLHGYFIRCLVYFEDKYPWCLELGSRKFSSVSEEKSRMSTASHLFLAIILGVSIASYIPLLAKNSLLQPPLASSLKVLRAQWPAEGAAISIHLGEVTHLRAWLRFDRYGGSLPSNGMTDVERSLITICDQIVPEEGHVFGDLPLSFSNGAVTIHFFPFDSKAFFDRFLRAAVSLFWTLTVHDGARELHHVTLELQDWDADRHDVVAIQLVINHKAGSGVLLA